MSEPLEPFAALVDLARRSGEQALGLPAQSDIVPHWSGIGFSLGGHRFIAPMNEVAEILAQPATTRLPGVRSWVRGVSNVRGRLLPLIDLENFFGDALGARKRHRVLAMELGDLYSGLIVSEVYGMQHIPVDSFSAQLPPGVEKYAAFLNGCYRHNDLSWSVFSLFKLTQNTEFCDAAAR
ncbi:MAG: twitching motility protein PilI [Paraglaciecola psychrophila]|jgi:twitching motility protein PilI